LVALFGSVCTYQLEYLGTLLEEVWLWLLASQLLLPHRQSNIFVKAQQLQPSNRPKELGRESNASYTQ
jgi:hypothetical protein